MIPRARPDTDPITLAIATASESANVIQPQTGYVATTAAQIHVHHFHHQSCQHHTDSVCVTLPHAASQTHPRSEDDYAVVFNSTNAHSPYPPALQPVAPTSSKHSNTEFVLPRKGVCTATIRHPSIAALCLHSPRPTMTCETNPPAHHIVQVIVLSDFNILLIISFLNEWKLYSLHLSEPCSTWDNTKRIDSCASNGK